MCQGGFESLSKNGTNREPRRVRYFENRGEIPMLTGELLSETQYCKNGCFAPSADLMKSFHLSISNVTCVTSLDATASLILTLMSLLIPENSGEP